jgi:hypothetical protein
MKLKYTARYQDLDRKPVEKSRSLTVNFIIMKTNFLKMGFPIAVVVLAVAGAFANNISRANLSSTIDVNGHLPASCEEKNVKCSTVQNSQMCTFSGQQLYRLNAAGTDCPDALFKKN